MFLDLSTEQLAVVLADLPRERCVAELGRVPYVPLDFTAGFIDAQPTDQLRHLLFAALLQARRRHREAKAQTLDRPTAADRPAA